MRIRARERSQVRGQEIEITTEDVYLMLVDSGARCAVTGIALDLSPPTDGQKKRRPWAPSIDRIDSTKGYTKNNSRIVCCAANFAMNMWGEGILVKMLQSYKTSGFAP